MKTKICTKCKIKKLLTEFSKHQNTIDNFNCWCKECCSIYYALNKQKIQSKAKNNHKKAPWIRILRSIKSRCENKNSQDYKTYGGRGIKCLITAEELKEIWFRDKAYLMDFPTIDKINNNGDYEFSNCQFLENVDNVKKQHNKAVVQYSLEGILIKKWPSQSEASRVLNISQGNIGSCCRKERSKASGFKWEYSTPPLTSHR